MKYQIDRAMAKYTLTTGRPMTRKMLAEAVLPNSRDSHRQVLIKQLAEGGTKRPDPQLLMKIAKTLHVDMNFLYGWNEYE